MARSLAGSGGAAGEDHAAGGGLQGSGNGDRQALADAAAGVFDHHHRALQQDELGARLHPEAFGHIEEIVQKPPHRDAAGIHAKDRVAHRAQRAGEFVDVATATEDELNTLAERGELTDAKTLVGLLWLARWRAGRWPLDWRAPA